MRTLCLLLVSIHLLAADIAAPCFDAGDCGSRFKISLLYWKLQSNWWGNNYAREFRVSGEVTTVLNGFDPGFNGGFRLEYENSIGTYQSYASWTRFTSRTGVDTQYEPVPVGGVNLFSDFDGVVIGTPTAIVEAVSRGSLHFSCNQIELGLSDPCSWGCGVQFIPSAGFSVARFTEKIEVRDSASFPTGTEFRVSRLESRFQGYGAHLAIGIHHQMNEALASYASLKFTGLCGDLDVEQGIKSQISGDIPPFQPLVSARDDVFTSRVIVQLAIGMESHSSIFCGEELALALGWEVMTLFDGFGDRVIRQGNPFMTIPFVKTIPFVSQPIYLQGLTAMAGLTF